MVARTRNHRPKVLILTHNYPRFIGDSSGVFIENVLMLLSERASFEVVAPHDSGIPETEMRNDIEIDRFRYGTDSNEILAYRGEMHLRAKSSPIRFLKFMRMYRKMAERKARNEQVDAMWAHWWIPGGWIGSRVKAGARKPLIITCHGTDVFLLGKFPWIKRSAARIFNSADRITVVSGFLKEGLIEHLRGKVPQLERKITVAPMPVRDDIFYPDDSVEPISGSIITASRLTRQKNLDKLLVAANRLRLEGIEFSVSIYGDGPEKENLMRKVSELSLEDYVTIGPVLSQDELARRYRLSEIAVLISEREGFGLTLLEAMLCGCAGVGARSGGITDIIREDGRDGILTDPSDEDSIYRVLQKLLTDRVYLSEMRKTCRESARRRFSDDVVAGKFKNLLDSILKADD